MASTVNEYTNGDYTWRLSKTSRTGRRWLVEQVRNTDGELLYSHKFSNKRGALMWIELNS